MKNLDANIVNDFKNYRNWLLHAIVIIDYDIELDELINTYTQFVLIISFGF
jgi:hypothetical protein